MKKNKEEIGILVKPKFKKGQVVKTTYYNHPFIIQTRLFDIDKNLLLYSCWCESRTEMFVEEDLIALVEKKNAIGEIYYE